MKKLIPINDPAILLEHDIHYAPKTLYEYHSRGTWPAGIFVKQGRKVLLCVEKFRKVIQSA